MAGGFEQAGFEALDGGGVGRAEGLRDALFVGATAGGGGGVLGGARGGGVFLVGGGGGVLVGAGGTASAFGGVSNDAIIAYCISRYIGRVIGGLLSSKLRARSSRQRISRTLSTRTDCISIAIICARSIVLDSIS